MLTEPGQLYRNHFFFVKGTMWCSDVTKDHRRIVSMSCAAIVKIVQLKSDYLEYVVSTEIEEINDSDPHSLGTVKLLWRPITLSCSQHIN